MAINEKLRERNKGICELCNNLASTEAYTVSPKPGDSIDNQVALCTTCLRAIEQKQAGDYWRCLEGSIWSPEPAVQALSYRLLHLCKEQDWAAGVLDAMEPDENIVQWAMSIYDLPDLHKDAYGTVLENGDTVVLTQGLNVKGTSFTAAKGTVVKRIRVVPDNTEQIEGKINDQTIVILTKYVKKG
ncbi:MAG: PhnA protein [Ferruginibacter sp.]|nr:PhnA protein [Ferruginibacter sp.]